MRRWTSRTSRKPSRAPSPGRSRECPSACRAAVSCSGTNRHGTGAAAPLGRNRDLVPQHPPQLRHAGAAIGAALEVGLQAGERRAGLRRGPDRLLADAEARADRPPLRRVHAGRPEDVFERGERPRLGLQRRPRARRKADRRTAKAPRSRSGREAPTRHAARRRLRDRRSSCATPWPRARRAPRRASAPAVWKKDRRPRASTRWRPPRS